MVGIDETVTVLGRSRSGTWLYVRNRDGDAGFIFGRRVLWDGDVDTLPIRETSGASGTSAALELDMWPLPGTVRCDNSGSGWTQQVYFNARGGNGRYTYIWNGVAVAGPTLGSTTCQIRSGGAAVINAETLTADPSKVHLFANGVSLHYR